MKLGRHVLQVNMYRLTESAFNMNHTFKMAAMSSFRAEKCCHLVSAHGVSAWRICGSVRQFLIRHTIVLVIFIAALTVCCRWRWPLLSACAFITLRTELAQAVLYLFNGMYAFGLLWHCLAVLY